MTPEIKIISNRIVNCYLVKTGAGFVLVDTSLPFQRGALKKALKQAGCGPGDLKLVVLTHADFDHTGNCVYLRKKYGVKIAIHRAEAGVLENGNMLLNRKNRRGIIYRTILRILGKLISSKFKPDIYLEGGEDFSAYGWDAKVLHLPGHSLGSIGVLTTGGDLFCGDLLENYKQPVKTTNVDNLAELNVSVARLKSLKIKFVYPGHGKPFAMTELIS